MGPKRSPFENLNVTGIKINPSHPNNNEFAAK